MSSSSRVGSSWATLVLKSAAATTQGSLFPQVPLQLTFHIEAGGVFGNVKQCWWLSFRAFPGHLGGVQTPGRGPEDPWGPCSCQQHHPHSAPAATCPSCSSLITLACVSPPRARPCVSPYPACIPSAFTPQCLAQLSLPRRGLPWPP